MLIYTAYIITFLYSLALLLVFLYSLAQLSLLLNYIGSKRKKTTDVVFDLSNPEEIPFVTIQLPVYNEKYVMERLLQAVSGIDYPKNKLQIQVLDDSTDDSAEKTACIVSNLQQQHFNIQHLRRSNRTHFKAGALKEGLTAAQGEFIAIFDADFLPGADWLKKTIIYFKDAEIGVVQTRWEHINRNYSMLTKLQAFALDAHFCEFCRIIRIVTV